MIGSRRIPSLPPPRPPMKRMAERAKEEQERTEAASKAAADAARRKAEHKAWKKQRLEGVVVDDRTKQGFLRAALTRLWTQLRARKWEGWPYSDGNPFIPVPHGCCACFNAC
jgi:hypothetical protein